MRVQIYALVIFLRTCDPHVAQPIERDRSLVKKDEMKERERRGERERERERNQD